MNRRALGNAGLDESSGAALAAEYGRNRIAAALTDNHDHLALAALVAGVATVKAIGLHVGGLETGRSNL